MKSNSMYFSQLGLHQFSYTFPLNRESLLLKPAKSSRIYWVPLQYMALQLALMVVVYRKKGSSM